MHWLTCYILFVGEGDVPESLRRIEKFLKASIEFHELDLLDREGLEDVFKKVWNYYQHTIALYTHKVRHVCRNCLEDVSI